MSARTRAPDRTKAMEELDAQTTPKAKELKGPEAQEEVEAYHTRREGPHIHKEDTMGEVRQNGGRIKARKGLTEVVTRGSRPQGTDGGIIPREEEAPPNSGLSAYKLSQGGGGKGRDCYQNTGGTKTWKNPERSFLQGSQRQPKTGAAVQPEQGGSEPGRRGDQVTWKPQEVLQAGQPGKSHHR